MFSSIFGKRKTSPEEDDTPPIPGPRSDDSFVVVDPLSPRGSLYPDVSGGGSPMPRSYPQRPAPPMPVFRTKSTEQNFHYLQGVPFVLSRELQMVSNKDAFATEIGDCLAILTSKLNMSGFHYDFSVEKSVLKEC